MAAQKKGEEQIMLMPSDAVLHVAELLGRLRLACRPERASEKFRVSWDRKSCRNVV